VGVFINPLFLVPPQKRGSGAGPGLGPLFFGVGGRGLGGGGVWGGGGVFSTREKVFGQGLGGLSQPMRRSS
jgi:hypothetical protein